MVLVELGVVEQRFQAVLEVLGGASVTDVARRYGVVRQTVHRWLRRYADSGVSGLADQSSRPHSCPHQMSPQVEAWWLRCVGRIRGGGLVRSCIGWGTRVWCRCLRCRRSIGRCCVTSLLIQGNVGSLVLRIGGGNGPSRWSCGRWM